MSCRTNMDQEGMVLRWSVAQMKIRALEADEQALLCDYAVR